MGNFSGEEVRRIGEKEELNHFMFLSYCTEHKPKCIDGLQYVCAAAAKLHNCRLGVCAVATGNDNVNETLVIYMSGEFVNLLLLNPIAVPFCII